MLLLERNLIPARDHIVKLMYILQSEFAALWIPWRGEDHLLKLWKVLLLLLLLLRGVCVEDEIFGLLLI